MQTFLNYQEDGGVSADTFSRVNDKSKTLEEGNDFPQPKMKLRHCYIIHNSFIFDFENLIEKSRIGKMHYKIEGPHKLWLLSVWFTPSVATFSTFVKKQ